MNQERDLARTHIAPSAPTHDDDLAPGRGNRSSRMHAPASPLVGGLLQRKASDANGVTEGADYAVASAASSPGSLLPEPIMRKFESSLGTDLSSVRVHTSSASQTAADSVGAKAYTMGQDIHFGAGQYDPSSSSGQHLLAHEVAHTVQQAGAAPAMQYKLEVSSPGDAAELEADHAADAMAAGRPARATAVARAISRAPDETIRSTQSGGVGGGGGEGGLPDVSDDPTNPIVGLKRQDGLDFGTTQRRPRVKLFQQKLNEKTGSNLAVDGMWGPKSSKALENFMLSQSTVPAEFVDKPTGDALMGKGGGGKGGGVVPPAPAPFNPHVESMLEAVFEEYHFIFEFQKEALQRLEADLAKIEKAESGLFEKLMLKAIGFVLEKFIGITLEALMSAVNELGASITPDQNKSATDAVLKGLNDEVMPLLATKLDQDKNKGVDDVGLFIDTQLHGATESTAEAHSRFLIHTKPAMSKLNPGDAPTQDETDPRVARADALRKKVKKSRLGAFDTEFNEALAKWTVYLAQKASKTEDTSGTDLSDAGDLGDSTPGLLVVEVNAEEPSRPIPIDKVHINGLSEKVRDRLNKSDRSLDALGFPARVQGDVDAPNGDIMLSRNENNDEFINEGETQTDSDGKTWLMERLKLENRGMPPDSSLNENLQNAAHIVLNEVLNARTSKHKIEKG